jgi:hypothetical protein
MQAPDVTKRSAWLNPGVLGIGLATTLADPGHEVPTALLPSLLTFLIAGDPLKLYRTVDGGARWANLELPSQETIQVTSSKAPCGERRARADRCHSRLINTGTTAFIWAPLGTLQMIDTRNGFGTAKCASGRRHNTLRKLGEVDPAPRCRKCSRQFPAGSQRIPRVRLQHAVQAFPRYGSEAA